MPGKTDTPKRKRKAHFYWWTLANALALCIAVLSWVLCLHIFGHPEMPQNYAMLKKLDLAKPPVGYALQEVPPGEAADPRALYRRYAELDDATMLQLNRVLIRNYITALSEPGLIQYVEGTFQVSDVRLLTEDDIFHPGFVVRGRAMMQPDEFSKAVPWPVTIDYLFPTSDEQAAELFRSGDQLAVSKAPNCALLLNVSRAHEEDTAIVRLTVAPIAMGEYQIGENESFSITTPESVNPGAPLPLFPES